MSLSWIDHCVDGLVEYCNSKDIFDIYSVLGIKIVKTFKEDPVLKKNEAVYLRSYFDTEIVFIRDDLPRQYEKFILAHELGHAVLHTEICTATFNRNLLNCGKLEKQANYFALKLLNIKIDNTDFEGYTIEQISKTLYVNEESLEYISDFFNPKHEHTFYEVMK
jgi:Zn-dependent peptidase ImmA (M78 family)|nr:MAG TPA: IrrE protein [Caudoviricetes sp.]